MYFPFFIAKRYLFSKKSHNIINFISGISVLGITIGTLALIVVLSIFNGLENLVVSLYNTFDSDVRITSVEGKTFDSSTFPYQEIKEINGVEFCTTMLEETVLLKYLDKQYIATMKGVENNFLFMSNLQSRMVEGYLQLEKDKINYAVLGLGIANNLALSTSNLYDPIQVYVPKRGDKISFNPEQAFNKKNTFPAGIFTINQDFDTKYILVSLQFAKEILEQTNHVSAVEINLKEGINESEIKNRIKKIIGNTFEVKTKHEKNELIFKTNQTEKWMTYLILTFILIIATFNVIGSLTMLILDKKQDISILRSMGADEKVIKKIFLFEGLLINTVGGLGGLLLGTMLCLGQQYFGFIRLDGGVVDYYPVSMELLDFIAVFITVIFIGFVASWYPANYILKKYMNTDN